MDVFEILGATILLSPMLLCMAGLIIYVVLDLGRKIFKVGNTPWKTIRHVHGLLTHLSVNAPSWSFIDLTAVCDSKQRIVMDQ